MHLAKHPLYTYIHMYPSAKKQANLIDLETKKKLGY